MGRGEDDRHVTSRFGGCYESPREAGMLHLASSGQRIFEVAIYNKEVQQLLRYGQRHSYFDDRWARPQTRTVVAHNEYEARQLISERFPPEDGFVIDRVSPSRY